MLASPNTEYPSIMIIYERWKVHKLSSKCISFNVFVQLFVENEKWKNR